jgi:hypothetical protein
MGLNTVREMNHTKFKYFVLIVGFSKTRDFIVPSTFAYENIIFFVNCDRLVINWSITQT